MTLQAFAPVVRDLFCGGGLAVRIVARSAPQTISALALAGAERQRLDLTECVSSVRFIVVQDEIVHIIREPFTGLKLVEPLVALFLSDCSLEVALHANAVAPLRRQFGGINDRTLAI